MPARPIVALDADGVLLDYSGAYADAWGRTFGERPARRDPTASLPMDEWAVRRLGGEELAVFRAQFNEEFWSTLHPMSGAVEACRRLAAAGYVLVCVTAMSAEFVSAREKNLASHGFPIDRVVPVPITIDGSNPKVDAVNSLGAVAFVDDYLPYFEGVSDSVHKALVRRGATGFPNIGDGLARVQSQHESLREFATWWLSRGPA